MSGLYIHIPFCASRCIYCDFYSTTSRNRSLFITQLLKEMKEASQGTIFPQDALHSIRTIYIGGGTPSQLSSIELQTLVNGLEQHFDLQDIEEFTIELNPEDVNTAYTRELPSQINRISMGVQSFVDEELQLIRRRHNSQRPIEAFQVLRQNGYQNISIDLMYGLPNQTLNSFEYSIDKAIALHPEHISAYNLTIEDGTPLNQLYDGTSLHSNGHIYPIPDENICNEMNTLLRHKLNEAGYIQYEISNFALPGFASKHNSSYWNSSPYLGLGPGAHSYDGHNHRWWNEPDLDAYLKGQQKIGEEFLSELDLYNERIMLSLRTRIGINVQHLSKDFPALLTSFTKNAQYMESKGMLISYKEMDNSYYRLSDKGLPLADFVIRKLMI